MPTPGEHKTVQARILEYAEAVGWTFVSREEAEERRAGFPTRRLGGNGGQECPPSVARAPLSIFFAKVREFNPRIAEAEGAFAGLVQRLHANPVDVFCGAPIVSDEQGTLARCTLFTGVLAGRKLR